MAVRAYVGLGSNLAHPRRQVAKALERLATTRGVRVLAVSPNYVTAPIGGPPQSDYVNAVALVSTSLAPGALLERLHAIERSQQRRRGMRRERSISICYYTARAESTRRSLRFRIRACTSAHSCCGRCST